MTHENKRKFWFFYTRDNLYDENSPYNLYAFTDDEELADRFKESRCMKIFYTKTNKLDRLEYNELVRHHMNCELQLFTGNCRMKDSIKLKEFTLPITTKEKQRILQDRAIYLHEHLFHYVWEHVDILKDKYLDALIVLGYPMLQSYIKYGDNPFSRTVEDNLIANDINILLEEFGWSFIESKED